MEPLNVLLRPLWAVAYILPKLFVLFYFVPFLWLLWGGGNSAFFHKLWDLKSSQSHFHRHLPSSRWRYRKLFFHCHSTILYERQTHSNISSLQTSCVESSVEASISHSIIQRIPLPLFSFLTIIVWV